MDNFELVRLFREFLEDFGDDYDSEEEILEAFKEIYSHDLEGNSDETPEERSMDLFYQAQNTYSDSRKIELLNEALEVNPDNFYAKQFLILHATETSKLREELLTFKKDLVSRWRKDTPQDGWYNFEERRYLISIYGVADTLFQIGLLKDAEKIFEELHELLKHDNLGTRYELMKIYVLTYSHDKAQKLFHETENSEQDDMMLFPMLVSSLLIGDKATAITLYQQFAEVNPEGVNFFRPLELDIDPIEVYFDSPQMRLSSIESFASVFQDLVPIFIQSDYLYNWMHERIADEEVGFDDYRSHFADTDIRSMTTNPLYADMLMDKKRILYHHNLRTLADFKKVTKKQALAISGIGPKTVETLIKNGVVFKGE